MTLDSVKDVVAILSALVGLTSALATGFAKIWSYCKKPKAAPAAELVEFAPAVTGPNPELSRKPPLTCSALPLVQAIAPVPPSVPLEQARAAVRPPAYAL